MVEPAALEGAGSELVGRAAVGSGHATTLANEHVGDRNGHRPTFKRRFVTKMDRNPAPRAALGSLKP